MPSYDPLLAARLLAFGERLRAARQFAGLSQEALAHAAGLHRTYVGAVERGERNITLGSLYAISDALRVAASELVGESA